MGDVNHEPTMEEILASIKKIIAEDGDGPTADPTPRARRGQSSPPAPSHDVLELTDPVGEAPDPGEEADPLVSPDTAEAGRAALAMLSTIAREHDEAHEAAGSEALEKMVREMIRPMLKDWLDAHLPEIVETMVAREIERIAGPR